MAQPIVGRLDANAAVARFALAPGGNAAPAPARALNLPVQARQAPPPALGRLLPLPLPAQQIPAPPPAPPAPPPILPPVILPPAPNRVVNAAGAAQRAAVRAPGQPHAPPDGHLGANVAAAAAQNYVQPALGNPPAVPAAAHHALAHGPVGGHLVPAAAHLADPVGQQQVPQVAPQQPGGPAAAAVQPVNNAAVLGAQHQPLLVAQAEQPAAGNFHGNVAAALVDQSLLGVAGNPAALAQSVSSNKRRRTASSVNPDRIRSAVDELRCQGLNDGLADSLLSALHGDLSDGVPSVSSSLSPEVSVAGRGLPLHRSSVPLVLKKLNFDASAMGAFLEQSDSKQSDACAFLTGKPFSLEKCEAFIEGHDPSEEFPITKFADIVSVVARRGMHTGCATLMLGDHPWSHLSVVGKLVVLAIKALIALEIIIALCENPDADPTILKKSVSNMWAAGFDLLASPGEKAKFILLRQQQLAERLAKLSARSAPSSSSSSSSPLPSSSAPPAPRRPSRPRNPEFCFRWNNNYTSCPDPCPYRRLHICWGCRQPHPLSHCPTKDLAPPMAKPGAVQSTPVLQVPTGSPFHLPASQVYNHGRQTNASSSNGAGGGFGGQAAHNVAAPPPMQGNALQFPQSGRQSAIGYGNHPATGQPVFNPSFAGYGPPPSQNSKKTGFQKGK